MIEYKNFFNTLPERKVFVEDFTKAAKRYQGLDSRIHQRALTIHKQLKIDALDALHIASAEEQKLTFSSRAIMLILGSTKDRFDLLLLWASYDMNRTTLLVIVGIIVLAVVGYILVTGTQEQEQTSTPPTKVSVVLDWFPWSGQAGIWVAKERGYFIEEGLDVTLNVPSDPTTILQTVSSGRDDFGINYQPDLLLGRAESVPVVSIAVLVQHPLYSLLTLQSSGLTRPRDLAGKKVAHSGLPFNSLVVDTMLKSDGVAGGLKQVEFVNAGFDLVPALIGKKVDGILGYESYEAISAANQGFPVHIMQAEQYGVPDYYEFVLVTSEEKIANDPDVVQRFVRATKRGYEDAMADPQGAVQLMKQVNPEMDLSIESKSIDVLVPLWKPENGVFGWQEESRWLDFAQWMKDNSLLSSDVDARQAFTNRFVESAKEYRK